MNPDEMDSNTGAPYFQPYDNIPQYQPYQENYSFMSQQVPYQHYSYPQYPEQNYYQPYYGYDQNHYSSDSYYNDYAYAPATMSNYFGNGSQDHALPNGELASAGHSKSNRSSRGWQANRRNAKSGKNPVQGNNGHSDMLDGGHSTSGATAAFEQSQEKENFVNGAASDFNPTVNSWDNKWDNTSHDKLKNRHHSSSNYRENRAGSSASHEHHSESGKSRKNSKWPLDSKYERGKTHEKYRDKPNRRYGIEAETSEAKSKSNKSRSHKKNAEEDSEDIDQRTRMIDQLTRGRYECMVCCENMKPDTAVWNCSNCYHLFHLFCIKKWARSSTAVVDGESSSEGWRCPACQNITEKVPNQYRCFCGKVRDPLYNRYDTPHSCGDVCHKNRKGDCKHPCTILCHPGACPPCSASVTKTCDCGKIKQTVRCGQNIGLKCDNVCGKKLNCDKHECKTVCHSGPCEPCDQSFPQNCYGGHTNRQVLCGSTEDQEISYCCQVPCNKVLACGNHRCESFCHPGDCAPCPLLPEEVTHCPCGKTLLSNLSDSTRDSCLAPVPTCDKICKKLLKCGPQGRHHTCKKTCHEGECLPCQGSTKIKCRCGTVEKMFLCTKAVEFNKNNPYLCDKRCTKKRSCGRHKCGEICCVKDEHICEMKCSRKLNCGRHKCGKTCHPGNCLPCYEASFDELTCRCGAEVIFPPVPCGTKPPECRQICRRQHDCDHTVRHHCHSEEVCPPCTELIEKMCAGGHELRKNIPCHIKHIVCGYPCGKLLPCGLHKCKQTCHKGDCLPEGEVCNQTCDMKREECGHPCGAPCHQDKPCPKTTCKAEMMIKCACGNRQAKIICQQGGEDSSDVPDFQKISVASWMNQGAVEISQYKKGGRKMLECDADCARLERNRRIALALEIENPDLQTKLGNQNYTDFIKDFARKYYEKAAGIEKALSELVNNAKQSKYPSRSHSFPAMNRENRQFVHELAEYYGCETQSYDNEPKKNVVATAYKNKCYLPNVSISVLIQREQKPSLPPPSILQSRERFGAMTTLRSINSRQESSTSSQTEPKPSTTSKTEPVIDYFDFSTS